jgi:hypothetical protein
MAKRGGGFIGQDGINAPDPATGVSASGGNTEATVSFTAPSDVGGAAITGYSVQSNNGDGSIPRLFNGSYDSKSFSVASQESSLLAFYIDNSGTKLFVVGYANDTVYQYTLSTAWDISSASYDSKSFSVASQMTVPRALEFKSDGTKMYVGEYPTIYQYSLSSAFDVSTASYDSVSFSPSSQTSTLHEVVLSPDGTKMYITAINESSLFQYTLSTPYNLSTASYASKSLSTSSQDSTPYGLAFSSDGTKVYVSGGNTYSVYEYSLTTAYDISTGSYSGGSFDASAQGANNQFDIVLKTDDSKMYLAGLSSDTVFQYSLPDYPTSSPVTVAGLTNGTSYTFNVWAINPFGWSSPSDASDAVEPFAAFGFFFGGNTGLGYVNTIEKLSLNSASNATDFGDIATAGGFKAAVGTPTRVVAGGTTSATLLEYITPSTAGNAVTFGNLQRNNAGTGAIGNSTYGLFGPRNNGALYDFERITIASTGNASNFGELGTETYNYGGGVNNSTIGLVFGGYDSFYSQSTNAISQKSLVSGADSSDFGNLTVARQYAVGGCSTTRGVMIGGRTPESNVIDYVTIATTGNATDFGDISSARGQGGGASSPLIAVVAGGYSSGYGINNIESITISTTGNSTDYGDLTGAVYGLYGVGTNHGGIS